MSSVEILNEIHTLESALISLLVSKHLVLYHHINVDIDIDVQRQIVETINQINAYYVLLNKN